MKKNLSHHVAPVEDLYAAMHALDTPVTVAAFMADLCTPTELAAMADRWHAARLLSQGFSQRDVAARTGVALGTVTRVARTLKSANGGYRQLLNQLSATEASNLSPLGQRAVG